MKVRSRFYILAILLIAAPCFVTLPAHADAGDDLRQARVAKKFRDMEMGAFCRIVGSATRGKTKYSTEELQIIHRVAAERPYSIRSQDRGGVLNREPILGMSMCGVIAALGMPVRNNRSVYQSGERHQFVYERPRRYVYLVGPSANLAVVTSFQD